MGGRLSELVLLLMLTVTGMLVAVIMTQPDLETLPEFTPGVTEVEREDSGMRVSLGTPDTPSIAPSRETFAGHSDLPNSNRSTNIVRHTREGVFRERLVSAKVGRRFRANRVGIMMELTGKGTSLSGALTDLGESRDGLHQTLAKAGHEPVAMIEGEAKSGGNAGRERGGGRFSAQMKLLVVLDSATDVSDLLGRSEIGNAGRVTRVSYALSDPGPALDEMRSEAIEAVRIQVADEGLGDWTEAGLKLHYPATGLQSWHATPMIMIQAEATVTLRFAN